MIAEILSTGDEILTGAVIDSNSAYIAEKLTEEGIVVSRQNCVGDDLNDLVAIIKEISERSDIAVLTGGLGPTEDDLSAEAVAKAAGVPLAFDAAADRSIEDYFGALKRSRNVSDKKQAMLPEGATCLANTVGTAPGFVMKIKKCSMFCIPGVPSEMEHMLLHSVMPYIKELKGDQGQINQVKTISLFGLPEAVVGEKLKGFSEAFSCIKLGLRARFPEIDIKLYANGRGETIVEKEMVKAESMVLERIGKWVFSLTGDSMAAEIGKLLCKNKETLAVAESCTGGLISSWITDVSGSSDYFLFSGVTYSNQAKMDILGVSEENLKQHGAVHEIIAQEMAEGVRHITGATYGLATSGIAGPTGGTEDKPVGTVCIGLATPDTSYGRRLLLSFKDRQKNKSIFSMTALELLRRELIKA